MGSRRTGGADRAAAVARRVQHLDLAGRRAEGQHGAVLERAHLRRLEAALLRDATHLPRAGDLG